MAREYTLAAPEVARGTFDKARIEEIYIGRRRVTVLVSLLDSDGNKVDRREGTFTIQQFLAAMATFDGSTMDFEDFMMDRLVATSVIPSGGTHQDE
jgi:hypothetical protein